MRIHRAEEVVRADPQAQYAGSFRKELNRLIQRTSRDAPGASTDAGIERNYQSRKLILI